MLTDGSGKDPSTIHQELAEESCGVSGEFEAFPRTLRCREELPRIVKIPVERPKDPLRNLWSGNF